jgi:Transglycosylase
MEQRPNRANNVPKQRRLRYACWAALTLLLGVLLLPYLLVPLYRVVNPVSTLMLWRWAHGMRVEKTFTPITRIGPALPITVIAAEDGRYCRHRGVDWEEIRERIEDVDNIREARGVSTITQQTAKNLFLSVAWAKFCAQGARATACPVDGSPPAEVARARNLSQHRRVGAQRSVWRRSGKPKRVQQVGPRAQPARGGSTGCGPTQPTTA